MPMELHKSLKNVGFTEKEASVYLALLKLKESLPSSVSRESGLKRPTTYLILDQLVSKGFASKLKRGKYFYFQPVSPHSVLETEYQKYKNFEEVLPDLLQLHERFNVKPQVSYFEGEKGIIHVMEDSLNTKGEILCWADVKMATKTLLSDYYPSYIKKKVERGIWLRGIFSFDNLAQKFKERGEEELREIYMIPKEEYPFKNEINIYDDKISIVSHQDKVGIIIRNSYIAETQRSIFNFAFKYAKMAEKELIG